MMSIDDDCHSNSTVNLKLSRPEVMKLFSCSTQLSTKFQLLIKTKMLKNKDFSGF